LAYCLSWSPLSWVAAFTTARADSQRVSSLRFWWLLRQEDRATGGNGQAAIRVRWLPVSGQLLILVWTAGLYTHYAFPLIIALCTGCYALWLALTARRGGVGKRIVRWLLFLALTLGLYAPWLGIAVRQLTSWPAPTSAGGFLEHLNTVITALVFGPVVPNQPVPWASILFILALIGAFPWPHVGHEDRMGSPRMEWLRMLLPLAWLLAPIVMILGLGLYRESYLKFLLISSPAYALLLARVAMGPTEWLMARDGAQEAEPGATTTAGTTTTRRRVFKAVGALAWSLGILSLIAATSAGALTRYFNDPSVARDDYRGVSQFIETTAQPADAVVLTAPGQIEVFSYYYTGDLPVNPLPRQRPLDTVQTLADLDALLVHQKIYVLYWAPKEADPQGIIENWLDQRGYKTLDQWHGNLRLAVYVMPESQPPDEVVDGLDLALGDQISLVGYRGWNLSPAAGEVTQLQLVWRADQTPERAYKVFLQLLDPRDQVIAQRDAEPAGESRPTTTWQPGEEVLDNHGLLIPPGTPPGSYRRIVGMYDAETLERLKLPDGSDSISLPPINVQRAKSPPPLDALEVQYRQRFDFGAISLMGHNRYKRGFGHAPETPLTPGDLLHVTFYWRANVSPRADWWFALSLSDKTGAEVTTLTAPLVSETYLTTLWQQDEIVRGEHDLLIPADLEPDSYRLSLTLLPDEITEAGSAYLGTVKVQRPK
jgi:mannosyltransferase